MLYLLLFLVGFLTDVCQCCEMGYYSSNRECQKCPKNCASCVSASLCTLCHTGYYGETCSESCPVYCHNSECNHISGHCLSCKEGYYNEVNNSCNKCPENCTTCNSKQYCFTCKSGYKGEYCQSICSRCKLGTSCDKHTGYCQSDCVDGFSGELCDKKCDYKCKSCNRYKQQECIFCVSDRYGPSCNKQCSETCDLNTCDVINGSCTFGCIDGYWGKMCEQTCLRQCNNQSCYQSNGECINGYIDVLNRNESNTNNSSVSPSVIIGVIMCVVVVIVVCATVLICIKIIRKRRFTGSNSSTSSKSSTWIKQRFKSPKSRTVRKRKMKAHEDIEAPAQDIADEKENMILLMINESDKKNRENESIGKDTYTGIERNPLYEKIIVEKNNRSETSHDKNETLSLITPIPENKDKENMERMTGVDEKTGAKESSVAEKIKRSGTIEPTKVEKIDRTGAIEPTKVENIERTGAIEPTKIEKIERTGAIEPTKVKTIKGTGAIEPTKVKKIERTGAIEPTKVEKIERTGAIEPTKVKKIQRTGAIEPTKVKKIQRTGAIEPTKVEEITGDIESTLFENTTSLTAQPNEKNEAATQIKQRNDNTYSNRVSTKKIQKQDFVSIKDKYVNSNMDDERIFNTSQHGKCSTVSGIPVASSLKTKDVTNKSQSIGPDNESQVETCGDINKGLTVNDTHFSNMNINDDETYHIQVSRLAEYVAKKEKASYRKEFLEVSSEGMYFKNQSKDLASSDMNRLKINCTRIRLPVVLEDDPSASINANFIDAGPFELKAYIAYMGPQVMLMSCKKAFWKTVFQEMCGTIVMLTNETLPEESCRCFSKSCPCSETYGDITVKCNGEQIHGSFTVRKYTIKKQMVERDVQRLMFTKWPSYSYQLPNDASNFVNFLKYANKFSNPIKRRTMVFCSSREERTGIYIALDILTKQGIDRGFVDIFNCVRRLREQRLNIIYSYEQYEFLHKALVISLKP